MQSTPKHIAMIMDGNGRWAKKRLLPRAVGHVKGAANVRAIVQACREFKVEYLTLFAFSTENWRRPEDEVTTLMDLFIQYLDKEVTEMREAGIRFRIIGERSAFAPALQERIERAEQETSHNTKLHLTVAANYGGQWDILRATQLWMQANPNATLANLEPHALKNYLSTKDLPDPDLLIRTGGESRLSNFLLWQMAYTELYFTDTYWPEFDRTELESAIGWFGKRVRRFGQTDEQVLGEN
jgi:undecaprenyl diphosphate synthase